MKKILYRINIKTGKVTIQPVGYTGEECKEATRELEGRLGVGDEQRKLTPDYYESTKESEDQRIGG